MGDMNKLPTIMGPTLPNIPWEDKPEDCSDVMWRSERNPIIPRDLLSCSNSIFNSAVVPYEDGFAGVFRVDDKRRAMLVQKPCKPCPPPGQTRG
jgi:beta-1,4-mannooligosaccharide/beta-1,4-mannosyl-N-acetylglucosamine phosphorylase